MSLGIQAIQVVKSFPNTDVPVLKGLDFSIQQGSFTALLGKSGSGKSTLLYILSGLDQPTSGKVIMDGEDFFSLDSKSMHRFRNEKMGFVFQFHYLLPELTALENVLMPARKRNKAEELESFARELLREFDLLHCESKYPAQMSGGEQQRVAIARALVQKPRFLFADEPTGNLDTVNGDKVMEIFQRINAQENTTIVMVTHDPDYANLAKNQIHLQDGRILPPLIGSARKNS